jgi:hypothetical protein
MIPSSYSPSTILYEVEEKAKIRFFSKLLLVFYLWILLEGILRKWVAPQLGTPLFLVKYAIIGLALLYISFFPERVSIRRYPYFPLLFFLLFYGLLSAVHCMVSYSAIVAAMGLTVHFGFIILPFLLSAVLRRYDQIEKALNFIPLILLSVSILGTIQYFAPQDSFINRYASEEDTSRYIALVGDYVRITGIFTYISTYASFLNITVLICLIRLIHMKGGLINNILLISSFLLGLINCLMTGSRSLLLILAVEVVIVLILNTINTRSERTFANIFVRIVLMSLLGIGALTQTRTGAVSLNAFAERVKANDTESKKRIQDTFTPFKFASKAGFVGFGIGTTYQAAWTFIADRKGMTLDFEEEGERLVLELGVFGFFLIMALRIILTIMAFRTYFSYREGYFKSLILALCIYLLLTNIGVIPSIYNWIENIIFWSVVGMLVVFAKLRQNLEEYEHMEAY